MKVNYKLIHTLDLWLLREKIEHEECRSRIVTDIEGIYPEEFADFLIELVNNQSLKNYSMLESYVNKVFSEIEGMDGDEILEYIDEFDYHWFVTKQEKLAMA